MDSEQFGQILQMVGQAGEGAFALAVVYMAVSFAKALTAPAATVAVAVIATRLIQFCVKYTSDSDVRMAEAKQRVRLEHYSAAYPSLAKKHAEGFLGGGDGE